MLMLFALQHRVNKTSTAIQTSKARSKYCMRKQFKQLASGTQLSNAAVGKE